MGKRKRDTLDILSTLLIAAVIIWFVWSWLEIVAHNRTDCQYSTMNLWVLVLKMCNVGRGV